MDNQNPGGYQQPPFEPGKSQAITSLVLGIISVALWFFGYTAIGSLVLGIIGILMAVNSKKNGLCRSHAHSRFRVIDNRYRRRRACVYCLCRLRRTVRGYPVRFGSLISLTRLRFRGRPVSDPCG